MLSGGEMGPSWIPVRIVIAQVGITLSGAALWTILGGGRAGIGALLGGGISVLLSVYFLVKVFSQHPDAGPQAVLAAFYRAQAWKMVMATVALSLAVMFFKDVFAPLVTTFAATLTVYWFALLWSDRADHGDE